MTEIKIDELFRIVKKGYIYNKNHQFKIYNKDKWTIKPNSIPDNFTYWDIKDNNGWSIAHEAAEKGYLPKDFNQWEIANKIGWSVAHVAAGYNNLPKDFNQWKIKDKDNWSVAHEAAENGYLPKDFNQWEIKDKYNRTVEEISAYYNFPEDFEDTDVI